ncbi:hypothetical protein ACETK8_06050 [Brevundimonas staleyi]|uniref:Uncharacterized protein n=1 Tax=Brevundimonas staleyi TaxID=74326 RepID=A0ABW0FNF0_9CAUL
MEAHRLIQTSVIALAMLIAPGTVLAQVDFRQIEGEARDLTFEGRGPFGGLSEVGALNRAWSVNTFYAVFRGDYPRQTVFWAIRREAGDHRGESGVVWADSRSCPAVERVLTDMERIPAVRPDAIRLGEESEILGIIFDGTAHTFWNSSARSGSQDARVGLEITGNVNSPIAVWWARSAEKLADCWAAEPPGPGPGSRPN